MSVSIFFCYAREDEALLNKLKTHLWPLQRERLIAIWHDRDISAGTEWEEEIKQHLETAQIILLLISPDFMRSDYCYGIEMQRALERHANGETVVIPIILRPGYWRIKPLSRLQVLPTDGKPVTGSFWHDLDTALFDVTEGVYKVVEQLTASTASALPVDAEAIPQQIALTRNNSPSAPIIPENLLQQTAHDYQPRQNVATSIAPLAVEKLVELRTLTGHTKNVSSVAISPNGQNLVSGSSDSTIKIWEFSTGKLLRTLSGHGESYVMSVAISPDGLSLVSGSNDRTVKVWQFSTGKLLRTLTDHTNDVDSVAISPNGQSLVSGSTDRTIKVWKLSTGKLVRTLTGHKAAVSSIAISPDGLSLVSGSYDRTIKVWGHKGT